MNARTLVAPTLGLLIALACALLAAQTIQRSGRTSPADVTSDGGRAPVTPLFSMDCGAGGSDFPKCNFDVADPEDNDVPFDRTLETSSPGLCSRGQYVRYALTPTRTLKSGAIGWALEHPRYAALIPGG